MEGIPSLKSVFTVCGKIDIIELFWNISEDIYWLILKFSISLSIENGVHIVSDNIIICYKIKPKNPKRLELLRDWPSVQYLISDREIVNY